MLYITQIRPVVTSHKMLLVVSYYFLCFLSEVSQGCFKGEKIKMCKYCSSCRRVHPDPVFLDTACEDPRDCCTEDRPCGNERGDCDTDHECQEGNILFANLYMYNIYKCL